MSVFFIIKGAVLCVGQVVSVNIKAKEYGCPRDLPFDGLKLTYITATDGSKEVTAVRRLGAGDSEGQSEEAGEEKAED